MNYYLGVDGGGSKTLAVVADGTGLIIGRGASGCGNHQIDAGVALRSIMQAVDRAMQQANLTKEYIRFATFGLAGADREKDYQILRPLIAGLGYENHDIVCDTVIGLRAGTRQSDGVVLICGTGTNCYGRNKQGEDLQCGGFGYRFGDFGGGGDLAVEVFRSVIRSWEGRERETLLTDAIIGTLGYESVERMFHDFLDNGTQIPHWVAKLLFEVAEVDPVARSILRRQGIELGITASAVIRKLGMEKDSFDLVLAGSILTKGDSGIIAEHIMESVGKTAPGCRLRKLTMEPVAGAILLAMESGGVGPIPELVYEHIEQSLIIKGGE